VAILNNIRLKIQAAILPDEELKAKIQAATVINPSVLNGPSITTAVINDNRGNQFTTAARTLKEVWKRYRGQAQYGNDIVREIINYRAGWIAGNGASISAPRKTEQKWIDEFVTKNKLDSTFITHAVKVGEVEGKCLLILRPVMGEDGWEIQIRTILWDKFDYKIIVDPEDETIIKSVEFYDSNKKKITLTPEQFVYVEVGKNGDINNPTPSIDGSILSKIINMDKAMSDWRNYNHFLGSMGVAGETKDAASSESVINSLSAKSGWEYGDTVVGPVRLYFPEPSGAAVAGIEKEITMNAKIISGATGVPIHIMGWASEMSNRATAEELNEGIYSTTASPRDRWAEALIELTKKAIEMHNRLNGESLSSEDIDAELAMVSRHQLKELIDVWLTLMDAGLISEDDVRMRIPGIDPTDVKKRLEEEKSNNIERQKEMIGVIQSDPNEDENDVREND
jgi:hypothetical protein